MIIKEINQELINIVSKENVRQYEPMKKHTTFNIGGMADIYVLADTKEQIQDILKIVKKYDVPLTIVGKGSNLLVKDKGIRGIVVKPNLKGITVDRDKITVSAGELLIKVAKIAAEKELSGLEFACGIPGTIGGAIKMNAGAYGSEMKDIVLKTTYIDMEGNINTIYNKEHEFDYRRSVFCKQKAIIIETELELKFGQKLEIEKKIEENKRNRIEKQPISMPSAGSIFKRGEGFITAKLIDECGLKGFTIGGAQVSEKHAGFIVNTGNATADDVINLISLIKNKVKKKFQVDIETEIQIIGE